MVTVDSSGWLEYFSNGPKAASFAPYLEEPQSIVTPTIIVYEVYKKLKREYGETPAKVAVSTLLQTTVVPLDESLAIFAADLAIRHSLPMADAIILATARSFEADLITSDSHFEGLAGVTVI